MRSLFLKIFLSYWLAQALFVVLAITVTLALRPQPDSPRWEYFRMTAAAKAAQTYEHGGRDELHAYLDELARTRHVHTYLFDDQNEELSRHHVAPWAEALAHGAQPKRGAVFGWLALDRYVTQATTGPGGRRYLLVAELPSGPHPFFFGRERFPGLGIIIAIISSGLVCYLLARYLTAPVVRLRAATQRLADGDLSARAGGRRSRRRDELAQLVRDFDGMAERLQNLVNAQSRLLNDISHELRSPLARLNVALGLARQRTGPQAESTLDRIELEANRLNELVGRLLALARMEDAGEPAEKVPVALEGVVLDVVNDAKFEAQGRNCRVHCQIDEDCVVLGSSALLHSAIENVVRNAMRYTKEGTDVELRLQCVSATNGPEAVVRISDHGPGVPEAALEKLFRPFYRLDDARGRQTGGVGLGLSIAERAVRLHGGSVKAANRPEGGLVVELRLPLAASPVPQPEVSRHAEVPSTKA